MTDLERRRRGGRPPKLYEFGGARLSLTDWSEVSGIPRHTIIDRMQAGWTFAEAVVYFVGDGPPGKGRRYNRRVEKTAARLAT
jgi:hypothetical protein